MIRPKKLQKGDLIGVISPASSPDDLSEINQGVNYLESLGYKVIVGKNVGKERGYLAGTDEQRVDDIHEMFKNKQVKAIFCVRGGYGTPRLLDKINYRLIKANPKIFTGFSDITALQLAFLQKAELVTFAGPMLTTNFSKNIDPFTEENFWNIVTTNKKIGRVHLPDNEKLIAIKNGNKTGRILGGNLTLIASIIGTAYFPSMKNKILFLEEVSEAPYRIDRIFNQLQLIKTFDQVSGIIFGAFTDCVENNHEKRSLSIGEVIEDYLEKYNKPIVYNLPHGHIPRFITIPQGIRVKLNASRGYLEFLESAVT